MESSILRPGERLDDLLIHGLRIIQHEQEFRFSLDAVLLAHFASLRPGDSWVDLGAGTGVLGLLLSTRGAAHVTGLELSPRLADMAGRSIALNGLADRLSAICGDVRQVSAGLLPGGRWDGVIANPPYRTTGGGDVSPNQGLAFARHEVAGSLEDFLAAARYLLRYRGRLAMIHLAERLTGVLAAMARLAIEPKRLRLIHTSAGKPAKLFLVEGVRGGRSGLSVLPPLFIYNQDGSYHPEIQAYYQAGEQSG